MNCYKELAFLILVRVVNKWTFTQTLFNPLRSHRPMNNNLEHKSLTEVADALEEIPEKCDFCSPLSYTGKGMYFIRNRSQILLLISEFRLLLILTL